MYRILGADGKEYGPAPEDVIRRWVAERRLDARSSIRRDGESGWKPLGEFPEFQTALAAGPRAAVPPMAPKLPPVSTAPAKPAMASSAASPAAVSPSTLGGGRKTSGLAIATMVTGIVSPCTAGLAGIVGIVLGIVALTKISRSGGQLKGKGLAITGLVLSAIFLLIGPPLVISAIVAQKQRAQYSRFNSGGECIANIRKLFMAVRLYANDNNDLFPPAATWCDAIQADVSGLNTFQCPARGDLRSGYGYNSALSGKSKFDIAPDTVMLFDSELGWNGSGGASALIAGPRHSGFITVVLVDGTIRQGDRRHLENLRWTP